MAICLFYLSESQNYQDHLYTSLSQQNLFLFSFSMYIAVISIWCNCTILARPQIYKLDMIAFYCLNHEGDCGLSGEFKILRLLHNHVVQILMYIGVLNH